MKGWIGVDLDGTLAHYEGWNDGVIGPPVPLMVARVKEWLSQGRDVRIMTARVSVPKGLPESQAYARIAEIKQQRQRIEVWCEKHLGRRLPITNEKDFAMIELWDDRCVQVEPNTGWRVDGREEPISMDGARPTLFEPPTVKEARPHG